MEEIDWKENDLDHAIVKSDLVNIVVEFKLRMSQTQTVRWSGENVV